MEAPLSSGKKQKLGVEMLRTTAWRPRDRCWEAVVGFSKAPPKGAPTGPGSWACSAEVVGGECVL